MKITKCYSTNNTTYSKGRSIKYIVVHYTAGVSSKAGSAANTAEWFKNPSAGGSADYIVDDETVVQYNGDIRNRYCWAVGGSKYSSMTTSEGGRFYGKCTNVNSISVEMCSNKTNKKSLGANDTDWYLTEKTVNNAAELVKQLMAEYGVPIDNVIMHHHVTGKVCPNPWCVSKERLKYWENFKSRLRKEDNEVVDTTRIIINGKEQTVSRIFKDGKNYICLSDLRGKGFEVGFDANTKTPDLSNTIKDISVEVDGRNATVKGININGSNYCNLRDIANAVGNMEIDYTDKPIIKTYRI